MEASVNHTPKTFVARFSLEKLVTMVSGVGMTDAFIS